MVRARDIVKRLDRRALVVVTAILAVLWLQAPRLFDEFQVEDDFRSFYWMNRFRDPELYPDDPLRGTMYTDVRFPWGDVPFYFNSLGYGLLFYLASFAVTPVLFSKVLALFTMPVAAWHLYGYGQSVRGRTTGTVLAIGFILLNLASPSSISVLHGLQRSFACPLIVALLYYLRRQRYVIAALVVLGTALIYAPVLLLTVVTWCLIALKPGWPPRRLSVAKGAMGPLLIAVLLSVLVLSPALVPRFAKAFGGNGMSRASTPSADAPGEPYVHLWERPEYRAGGYQQLFSVFPFVGRGGLVNQPSDARLLLILLAIGGLIFLVRGRRAFDLPVEIWCVLWASLILYALAWLTVWAADSFLLYLPSRYTRVGLFLFLSTFVLWNAPHVVKETPTFLLRNRKKLVWLIVGVDLFVLGLVLLSPSERAIYNGLNLKWLLAPLGLAFGALGVVVVTRPLPSAEGANALGRSLAGRTFIAVVAVICFLGWSVYARDVSGGQFLDPPRAERDLLKFLEMLPKGALLAGTPRALSNVPLFAKRQVLFSHEQPSGSASLIRQALDAYYAQGEQEVVDFCRAQGVDYMVVDLEAYSQEYLAAGQVLYEPYNRELLSRIGDRDAFALARVPEEVRVFQSEELFVVPCDALASFR